MRTVVVIIMIVISANLWGIDLHNHSYTAITPPPSHINLKGVITEESVELTFIAHESNVRYFVIERTHSENLNFIKIGHLLPSELNTEYLFTDSDVIKGSSYHYRIISVTDDDKKSHSNIITIKVGHTIIGKKSIHKYIYQEDHNIAMRLISNHDAQLEGAIYNNTGDLIYSLSNKNVENGLNEFLFDISSITSDDYLLIMKVGKENIIERITINPH